MNNVLFFQDGSGQRKSRFVNLFACVLGILFFSGCNVVESTRTFPPASLSYPTLTQVSTEIVSLPSLNFTQIPTWTPVVTLLPEIKNQNLIELFSTNGGCDFPCWWGVGPGDSIQKIAELGRFVGKSLNQDASSYYYTLSLDSLSSADFDVNFYVNDHNESVQRIEVSLLEPSRFRDYYNAFNERLSLSGLLSRFGKPSDVLLIVEPLGGPGVAREYFLYLLYEHQNFGATYWGTVDFEDPIRICSIRVEDYHLKGIFLSLQEPQREIIKLSRFSMHQFMPLEQVTSFSLDDFYRIFSNPENSDCIETEIGYWEE